MKIFHATDLHFTQAWFTYITDAQKEVDAICLTGDFLDPQHDVSIPEQIRWIRTWMRTISVPLLVCSGNHDIEEDASWLETLEHAYGDTRSVTLQGVRFGCVPYIAPDFLEFDECDVLLYHLPPAKTATALHQKKQEDWGDSELARLLKHQLLAPKVVLCGHMHTPQNTTDTVNRTRIYNPGVGTNPSIPNHHLIDI